VRAGDDAVATRGSRGRILCGPHAQPLSGVRGWRLAEHNPFGSPTETFANYGERKAILYRSSDAVAGCFQQASRGPERSWKIFWSHKLHPASYTPKHFAVSRDTFPLQQPNRNASTEPSSSVTEFRQTPLSQSVPHVVLGSHLLCTRAYDSSLVLGRNRTGIR
jgi:hypothetical protein